MKIVCKQDNCVNAKINRFWDLNTIRISDSEYSVYDKFIDSIKLRTVVIQLLYHSKKTAQC